MSIADIPSTINFRCKADALEWESKAMDRPYREEFFAAIATHLRSPGTEPWTILELGSGPGFLASYLLEALPTVRMELLDFSSPMHKLAGKRLGVLIDRVKFVERDFKKQNWIRGLGPYDAVVTLQAVHELRHKRHAEKLHREVKKVLKADGQYLVCDHYIGDNGMKNDQLFMTVDEQRSSLASAGFNVTDILIKGGRALYLAV